MIRSALFRVSLLAALALPAAGAADDVSKGIELFERGEFELSAEVLAPLAEAGSAPAQYVLGVMFLNQVVDSPDPGAAARLIESAAEMNHLQAQTELARMYRDGDGIGQDFARMMAWYQRAAEQGDVGAQLFVADGYAYGYGVEADLVEAYKWYEIAIQYWGALAVRAREVVAERMSDEEIAEGTRRAGAWLESNAQRK